MNSLDILILIFGIALGIAFIYIIWKYVKGLRGSPRELWILYGAKVIEYTAYGAMNMTFVLFLTADCGLGDISAGSYIGAWSIIVTVGTILVGAVVDAIGIKKTLLFGTILLVVARIFMPFITNIYGISILGFIPMAIGIAMLGPVLSVGIKRYTTKEGATLGFGLFYTLMNVGWASGALVFDEVRGYFGEHEMTTIITNIQLSTYQIIFLIGFFLTLPTLFLILIMRDRVEMTEKGIIIGKASTDNIGNSILVTIGNVSKKAFKETVAILRSVVKEKTFWYFMLMLGTLVFVRLVFYHFHYTFPKYGIRVLGEGVKIGNIYGVLNPVMIVFLVPFIAALTSKISSYRMMMIGTTISAFSVFIATMPETFFEPLMNTMFSELVFDRWLEVPLAEQRPYFLILVIFIATFTVGEALWSPRLMQFTAEIAPKGREGSYIALSYLPYFGAKFIAGPLSGWLLATYVPIELMEDGTQKVLDTTYHYMVWFWIGGMAIVSPIGLLVLRKIFLRTEEQRKLEDAKEAEELAKEDQAS